MTLDNGYDEGINDCDDYDNIVDFTEKTIKRKFRKKRRKNERYTVTMVASGVR